MSKLSIAIPVYKRPNLLDKCLESIVVQLNKSSDVSIYIYDDSCDETNLNCISKYKAQYEKIYHIRNAINLGICRNIHKALTETVAEYVWLIGEDDLFLKGSIIKIINIITNEQPSFIYAEYSYVSNDYSRIHKNKVLDYHVCGKINSRKFYEECSWAIGFIGSCVLRTDTIRGLISEDLMETYFNHVWIISRAIQDKSIYITTDPMIYNRAEGGKSTTWAGQAFVVFEGLYIVIDRLGGIYGRASRNRALTTLDKKLGCFTLENLLCSRNNGCFDKLKIQEIVKSKISLFNKLKTILVVPLPRNTYKILKKIIRAIR